MLSLVVIGDVVGSRSAPSRGELQRSLATAAAGVNALARRRLASPYTITLGDEFQAVYKSPRGLFADFWTLFDALHPVALRLAVGIGAIATPINTKQALGMDGPAFHRAREAMGTLKRESESVIRLDGGGADLELANHAVRLACRLLARSKRPVLSTLVCLARGLSVEETARRARVTQRAIFKRISANSLREVLAIAGAVESRIEAVMGAGDER